jgi:hypothetical protein
MQWRDQAWLQWDAAHSPAVYLLLKKRQRSHRWLAGGRGSD